MRIINFMALLTTCASPLWLGGNAFGQVASDVKATTEQAAPKSDQSTDKSFVRLVRGEDKLLRSMDVAVVRFVPEAGNDDAMFVDLISAIHVADRSYYERLNEIFRDYDAVLYELVAPEGTRVPKGAAEHNSPVSWLQGAMTKVLGLTFQLEEVDYTVDNLVHADMSPEEFAQSMKDRGESLLGMMLKMMAQDYLQQSQELGRTSELRLLAALVSSNRKHELKLFMAEQFADLDRMMRILEGEKGSTLVTERNKKALSVLAREMAAGKKRLAIFYGAGHMKDMSAQLERNFALKRGATTWLTAWDLSASEQQK